MRPLIALMLFTTIVPELITGSTPLARFAQPGVFLFLLVGYGLAVLVIREFAVRARMGAGGIFLAGIAYGLFNEALLAKTSILTTGLPIAEFSGYGMAFGIGVPWTLTISVWHACASVWFPIAFVHALFPHRAASPWMPAWVLGLLSTLLLLFGCASFLSPQRIQGTPQQLVLLLGCMALLFEAASFCRRAHVADRPSIRAFWLGCSVFVAMFIVLSKTLAGRHVPIALYLTALSGIVLLYAWRLQRKGWLTGPGLLLFALGWYAQNLLLSTLFKLTLGAKLEALLAAALCVPPMAWYGRRLLRQDAAG